MAAGSTTSTPVLAHLRAVEAPHGHAAVGRPLRARDDPPGGEILNSWRHLGGVEARGAPAAGELGASPPARLAPDRRIWRRGRDPSEEERRMGPWWPSPPRRGHGSAAGERLHPWEGAARASRPHLRRAAARAW
jgi:hypothetical protein